MIICCGEALIDMLPAQAGEGQKAYVPHTGGAVFNTAIALGRLDVGVGLISGISSDLFGEMLRMDLTNSHVDTSLIVQSNRPTTLAFVDLVDGQASYTFYDENTAGRMLVASDLPAIPDNVTTLFCGGISLAVEPGADAYADLIEREAARRIVMLDPNVRPSFISDEPRYRARIARLVGACDILKISDEDLNWLEPVGTTLADKIQKLTGPSLKIVTEGRNGASAYMHNDRVVHVPAKEVDTVDTVGAGDSFNAGFLCHLNKIGALTGSSLDQLADEQIANGLAFAHAVAALTVSREGADPPWLLELSVDTHP